MKLYRDLLFLHGHIADPALAISLAADNPAAPAFRSPAMDLFKSLMYLGGRPMHSGHNYDLDEPFEPSFGNHVANERLFGKSLAPPAARDVHAAQVARGFAAQGCG